MDLAPLERLFLTGDAKGINNFLEKDDRLVYQVALDVLEGRYQDAIQKTRSEGALPELKIADAPSYDSMVKALHDGVESYVEKGGSSSNNNEADAQEREYIALLAAVACLYMCIQNNWTGPPSTDMPKSPLHTGENVTELEKEALAALQVDGEDLFPQFQFPIYLAVARELIVMSHMFTSCDSIFWWTLRTVLFHQRFLRNPSSTLHTKIQDLAPRVIAGYGVVETVEDRAMATQVFLELLQGFQLFSDGETVTKYLQQAMEASGIVLNLTGHMGQRLKYQTFQTSQLVAEISRVEMDETMRENESQSEDEGEFLGTKPRKVGLDVDNEALEDVKFKDGSAVDKATLSPLEQALVLAGCVEEMQNNPVDGITDEKVAALNERVKNNPNNWMVFSTYLLNKSRLEGKRSRTSERAVLQMQVLVDQFDDEEPNVNERAKYVFSLHFPTRWELQREVAEAFLSLGVARTALEIFERLELWDRIVDCYRVMDEEKKAEKVIRERLAIKETPTLLCALGDITQDPENYRKAFELSGNRNSFAMRRLGTYHLRKGEFSEAIEAFERALKINALFPGIWFSLGCCYMQQENYESAAKSLSQAVQLEGDDAECWNNLASVYVRLGKAQEAANAYREALKSQNDNWKIWHNFLLVVTDMGSTSEAVFALNRLIDLNAQAVDLDVVRKLVDELPKVSDDDEEAVKKSAQRQVKKMREALAHLTSKITNNPDIWSVCATMHEVTGDPQKSYDCLMKQVRAVQKAGWEETEESVQSLVQVLQRASETALKLDGAQAAYSLKLTTKSAMKKVAERFPIEAEKLSAIATTLAGAK